MIDRLLKLADLGVLHGAVPAEGVDLRKCTIIYGENGRGKTSIARLLSSLASGDCSGLGPLCSIGSDQTPSAEIVVSKSHYLLRDYTWTPQPLPTVVVFDTDFVGRNVFTGTSVEPGHRKNLCTFAVGEKGVPLAKAVEKWNADIKQTSDRIREAEQQVAAIAGSAAEVASFLALTEDDKIDERIETAAKSLQGARDAETLRGRPGLQPMDIFVAPLAEQVAVLALTVQDMAAAAIEMTRRHIQEHLGPAGEEWLSQGVGYLKDEQCPFCGQSMSEMDLLEAFRGYFGDAYALLREKVDATAALVAASSSELVLERMRTSLAANETVAEFWRKYVPLPLIISPLASAETAIAASQELLAPAFAQKKTDPLSPVEPSRSLDELWAAYEAATEGISSYNEAVAAANAVIERRRTEILSGTISEAEGDLRRMQLHKKRWEPDTAQRCQTLIDLYSTKGEQEKKKGEAKARLDEHMKQMMDAYQAAANAFLSKCNVAFKIVKMGVGYAGGEPRADYHIELLGRRVSVASRATDGPHFDTMLSDGDRRTLALAFFLARLARDPDISRRIVVLDDPVSSLDTHRASHVVSAAISMAEQCDQLIVTTHDPLFAMELSACLVHAKKKVGDLLVLRLDRDEDHSTLSECDPNELHETLLQRSITSLHTFADGPDGVSPLEAVQSIRPALEGMLRLKYPKEFRDAWQFGTMVNLIRDAETSSRLYRLQPEAGELYEVCNYYATAYMHVDRPHSATVPADGDALSWVKRALDLLERI